MTQAEVERRLAPRAQGEPVSFKGADLSGVVLHGVVFGEGREERNPAVLQGVSFRGATLTGVKFSRCELTDVDFREARLHRCDLRYVVTTRTTFEDADIEDCDFYRAYFDAGTVFRPRRMRHVSLTNAWLQGATGMTRETFGPEALVQEAGDDRYRGFLEQTKADSPYSGELGAVTPGRFAEAAAVYRSLSGVWSSQGMFGDAGWAYARGRELERRDASPRHAGTPSRMPRYAALTLSKLVSGYGLRMERVLATLAAVWLLPALVYGVAGAVRDESGREAGLGDTLLYSLGQLTSSAPARLGTDLGWAEWLGTGQILAGVTLLGLLGFVLGNAIRSS